MLVWMILKRILKIFAAEELRIHFDTDEILNNALEYHPDEAEQPWHEGDSIEDWWGDIKREECIPVKIVLCGPNDYSYILQIVNSEDKMSSTYPEIIDLEMLNRDMIEKSNFLLEFCKKYNIKYIEKPNWYLSMYAG